MDILDVARLLRFQTDWERRFHEYNLLLDAGIPAEEAARIAGEAERDRQALADVEQELAA